MRASSGVATGSSYLDIQGALGITKHNGGMTATLELLRLCRVADAREVLYVGSGIGVGPCVIARRSAARVVALDISEPMLAWTRLRAREQGLIDRIETRPGDVLSLPFEADRFEAVLVESVLAFVEDKARALQECVRVTKPGGYVGLNETVWLLRPPESKHAENAAAFGACIETAEEWHRLWSASGLADRTSVVASIGLRDEVLSRIQWVGWRWALRAYGRLIRLLRDHPASRQAIRDQFRAPAGVMRLMGFALMTGRKPG
jgi:ubiquinone/menaquinone biosynthesis C-methylase UbiE